jgi:hypothetical protein
VRGAANASSASLCVTLSFRSLGFDVVGEVLSNSNLDPFSCRRENWSKLGNFEDSSSVGGDDFASKAANGSPLATRIGDGVGFGPGAWGVVVGRPRRIGTTSGIAAFCWVGGEKAAPTVGDACELGLGNDWFRFVCKSVLPAYI